MEPRVQGGGIPSAGDWVVTFEYPAPPLESVAGDGGRRNVVLAALDVAARKRRYVVETVFSEKPAAQASS